MSILISGRIFALVMLILIWIFILGGMEMAKKQKLQFRKLTGLDALPEMVGRAAEMNKPVHFTTGLGSLTESVAPQLVAGLAVLAHVAELCANYGVNLIYSVYAAQVMPIATELMKEAYVKAGKAEEFHAEEQVRYLSGEQFAYASAVQGIAERERPAANIMIGPFYAESMLFAETFNRIGSIQLAGTARGYQIPFFAVICDYLLIGEEIYAAGAYLSGDPVQAGTTRGQDYGKILALILIILGVLATAAGSSFIVDLLGM
ncbi:MAG TPA: DUF6754 domain-containing protein [Candidatus Desulfaltia sp.]|nr:DUF6754 domain-containing protein [Candidatus Desulfaltia sp.]